METAGEVQLLLAPECTPLLPEHLRHSEASEQLQSGTAGAMTSKHKETFKDFFFPLKSSEE